MGEMYSNDRRVWIWLASGTLVICGLTAVGMHVGTAKPDAAAIPVVKGMAVAGTQPAPVPKILTKNADYRSFLQEPDHQGMLAYSPAYKAKSEEIERQVSTLSDPDLKQRQAETAWASVDKTQYVEDGKKRFLAARHACLQSHRNDWFEVGHIEYGGELVVEDVAASPIHLAEAVYIPFPLASMDRVYSKFHAIIGSSLETDASNLIANSSCSAQMRRACRNLGGSAEECASPSAIEQMERAGIGCNETPTIEEARKTIESSERKERLVLVGQGDLVAHRIDKLFFVDYNTENILGEIPTESLPASKMDWRFADTPNPAAKKAPTNEQPQTTEPS